MGDVAWYREMLGYRFTEYTLLDDESDIVIFAMLTTNEKSHDLGLLCDFSDIPGRLNHSRSGLTPSRTYLERRMC